MQILEILQLKKLISDLHNFKKDYYDSDEPQ